MVLSQIPGASYIYLVLILTGIFFDKKFGFHIANFSIFYQRIDFSKKFQGYVFIKNLVWFILGQYV